MPKIHLHREKSPRGRRPGGQTWTKLIIVAVVSVGIAIALSFGLVFGLRRHRERENNDPQPSNFPNSPNLIPGLNPGPFNADPIPSPEPWKTIWKPAPNTAWQIILNQAIDLPASATNTTPPEAEVWDIDLFLNSKETIDTLHRLEKKVICYFSAGSYEPDRPDSYEFRESEKGKKLAGWPDERWLDLTRLHVLGIMQRRIQLAKYKGCDGVDPDNIDGYVSCVIFSLMHTCLLVP
jgi:hypothetical protein